MKGIYLMLAAVFITLMISPAAYSTESSNLSMRYPMKPDVMPYIDYEADNSSDESSSDEKSVEWDATGSEVTPGPLGNGTRSPKVTEEKKEMLMDLLERWLMENGSREYVKKEFEYHGGMGSMDIFQHECRITCYATSTLLDRYDFIIEENTTAKNIRIISVRGPSTRDLTATPPKPIKMVGSLGLPNTDEPSEHEENTTNLEMLPNTNEPSEQEEMTAGDSNLGIATIVLIAFACMHQRKLYK